MSNTKLHPNPFTQALKDRKEGVLLGPVTIDNLLKTGEELWNQYAPRFPRTELRGEFINNVEDQK